MLPAVPCSCSADPRHGGHIPSNTATSARVCRPTSHLNFVQHGGHVQGQQALTDRLQQGCRGGIVVPLQVLQSERQGQARAGEQHCQQTQRCVCTHKLASKEHSQRAFTGKPVPLPPLPAPAHLKAYGQEAEEALLALESGKCARRAKQVPCRLPVLQLDAL